MKSKFKPLILLPVLLLTTGCSFNFTYKVRGVTYDISGGGSGTDWDSGVDDRGEYTLKVWVAETVVTTTESALTMFKAQMADKGVKLTINVAKMDEPDAAAMMKQDPSSGADVYCFAQDQLAALRKSNALAKLPASLVKRVSAENTTKSVDAATIDGNVWALPATSDNGYFLYYNKAILSESDVENVETILEKSKAAGKNFFFDAETNGYYGAGYYMATGCKSDWTLDSKGKFIKYDDNYNTDDGFIAAKGLKALLTHTAWRTGHNASRFKDAASAVVSGVWDYNVAKKELGDNLGCTDLPSYTVDGKTYHLGSFSGFKMFGIKPTRDEKRLSVCQKLAYFLAGEECQRRRLSSEKWGPTNNVVLETETEATTNPALAALAKQDEFANVQKPTPGAWFNAVGSLGTTIKKSKNDQEIRTALQTYEDGLEALLEED